MLLFPSHWPAEWLVKVVPGMAYSTALRCSGSCAPASAPRLRITRWRPYAVDSGTFHDGGCRLWPRWHALRRHGRFHHPGLALAGKILRVTAEGEIRSDNPFAGSPIYSYGHRNVQGLAWHPQSGVLFASEHGPTGEFGLHARDEINLIKPGGNYGWPDGTCAVSRPKLNRPACVLG